MKNGDRPLASRSVERALARKRSKYEGEVERLVEAAYTVMSEQDTVDPTVSDILEEAGLSTAAFYRHFESKEALLLGAIESGAGRVVTYLAHHMDKVPDPSEKISAWIRAMFGQLRTTKLLAENRPFLLAYPRLSSAFPEETDRLSRALRAPLLEAMNEAVDYDKDTTRDAETECFLTYQQVYSLMIYHAAVRQTPTAVMIERIVDHCHRALGLDATKRATTARRSQNSK